MPSTPAGHIGWSPLGETGPALTPTRLPSPTERLCDHCVDVDVPSPGPPTPTPTRGPPSSWDVPICLWPVLLLLFGLVALGVTLALVNRGDRP